MSSTSPPIQNDILAALSTSDLALLEPSLEPVDLPLRHVLEQANKQSTSTKAPVRTPERNLDGPDEQAWQG